MRPDVAHGLRDLLAQIATPLVAAFDVCEMDDDARAMVRGSADRLREVIETLDGLVLSQEATEDAIDRLQQPHKRTRG